MRLIEQYFIFNIMVKFFLVFFRLDQPHNPMVNSGAIMSASILLYLLKPYMNMAQKYDYVFDFFKVKNRTFESKNLMLFSARIFLHSSPLMIHNEFMMPRRKCFLAIDFCGSKNILWRESKMFSFFLKYNLANVVFHLMKIINR